jgi:YVTN family beta-propeller protein
VYVVSNDYNAVSVIDGVSNTVTAIVPVGGGPQGVAVDAVRGTVYVANDGDGTVTVIDGASNTVTATVPVAR